MPLEAAGQKGEPHRFLATLYEEFSVLCDEYEAGTDLDLLFLAYLRLTSRFGFFRYGPIAIDTHVVEEIFARANAVSAGHRGETIAGRDRARFDELLSEEIRRSGRTRADELHCLLAFMRAGAGLPARVFSELGVSPEAVEHFGRSGGLRGAELEKLFSPEEAAAYLGVHVQTVRAWVRAGRLPASRLTGQRALRIRASDLLSVLEPVDAGEFNESGLNAGE